MLSLKSFFKSIVKLIFNRKEQEFNQEEKIMNHQESQDKNGLSYDKIEESLSKLSKKSDDKGFLNSLHTNVNNLYNKFKCLSNKNKQKELNSDQFKKIATDIKSLNFFSDDKQFLSNIKNIITEMETQRELSDCEKLSKLFEKQSAQIEAISKKLEPIEQQGGNIADIAHSTDKIDDIAKVIDSSFWQKFKDKMPKIDFSQINQQIKDLKYDTNQKVEKSTLSLSNKIDNKIDNIKFPPAPKIPTDYLKKDDFSFELNAKFRELEDLKETSENLEVVPTKLINIENKLKELSEKLENLPTSDTSKTPTTIPKEEKAVIDLAKYMSDGIAQFENIAKEYVSKIQELENLENMKKKHQKELEESKDEGVKLGKEAGEVELIEKIANQYPTNFNAIKSIFENHLEEKYSKDEEITITNDNKNEIMSFVEGEGEVELGKYKVTTPAILLDRKVIVKAKIEKIIDEIK
jgi:hypothetical protein